MKEDRGHMAIMSHTRFRYSFTIHWYVSIPDLLYTSGMWTIVRSKISSKEVIVGADAEALYQSHDML